jgi:enamine deaminase RidA (YjgF/YER057c/UK114 family)
VVEVTGPGRTVYFAGQLGIDKSGKMGANACEQMEMAFENVKAALASVGASFEHVVKITNYIVDIGTNVAHFREVRDKYVNKAAPAGGLRCAARASRNEPMLAASAEPATNKTRRLPGWGNIFDLRDTIPELLPPAR